MTFSNKDAQSVVYDLIDTIQKNKDYLSELDGKIGDGDHGINMNKGFTLCEKKLEGKKLSMSQALRVLGQTLMEDIGGSMGPLYGVFFETMADKSEEVSEIDAATFEAMLKSALSEVLFIGNAQRGDKSLLETLFPAQEAFSAALAEGKNFAEALEAMRFAAETGWRSTEDMIAKIGRASRLGERSRGYLDPGATSCYLILDSFASSIKKLIK